jgi:CHAT domain-containing protein
LYDALVRPAENLIPPGARVVLVPDRALHRLNFETLAAGGEQAHFWIEDAVLSVAPSVSVALEQSNDAARPPKSLLLVGNAEPPVADYPKLPQAGREIEAIQQKFPGLERKVATGAGATPGFYRDAHPERFSLIHFAAHGRENRASPLDSAIVLSPQAGAYLLYARDIAQQPLKADLVTVASCRSAGVREYPGEGLVGLAWAFLQAGARNVIAGLWDVSDQSTADVMASLYAGIAAGRPPEVALRDAKLVLVRGKVPYRLPYYWGPFQIYR